MASASHRQDNMTTDVSNRSLQRVALQVNQAGDRVWRTAPRLKTVLRSAYYRLNARKDQDRLEAP
jgi:hypothetical protein